MSFTTHKVSSTGSGHFAEYLKEQEGFVASVKASIASLDTPGSLDDLAAYYGAEANNHILFDRLLGTGASEVLGISNLTREQFMDIGNGRWNGKQLCGMGNQPVWATDDNGKILKDEKNNKIALRHPDGRQVTRRHRWGFIDATTAAPKSVMEYMIHTNPKVRSQILDAWEASNLEWIKAMEERAPVVRATISGEYKEGTKQQGSKSERVVGAKLIIIPATQLAARHTHSTLGRGAAPDPHLHTHHAIATMAFYEDPDYPGGWHPFTLDERDIKRFADQANQILMGDFARRLEDMGIAINYDSFEQSRRGKVLWEIAGVSKEAIRHHSSNTSDRLKKLIKEFERENLHPPTRQQLDNIMRVTRTKKGTKEGDKEADSVGAWDRWKSDLKAHGLGLGPLMPGKPIERKSEQERKKILRDRLFDLQGTQSPLGLCRDDSVFTEAEIMEAIERCSVDLGFTEDEKKAIEREVRGEIVLSRDANDDRYKLYTTNQQVNKERRLIRGMDLIARKPVLQPSKEAVAKAFDSQQFSLDPGQREAVIAASKSSWTHIGGPAGTGKSSALKALRESLENDQLVTKTVVVSTAAATAQRSAEKVGADFFGSVESIEGQVKKGKLSIDDNTLIIIDEAAMMDTDHLDRLLMAGKAKGRYVLVGDDRQLGPIGPSGWYEHSTEKHGITEIRKIHRQRDVEDKHTYNLLRVGHIHESTEAVKRLADRGRIHITDDADERQLKVFSDYQMFRDTKINPETGKPLSAEDIVIQVETKNQDVDTFNRMVQFDRKQRGEIDERGFEVTDEASGRTWSLHQGDAIMFHRPFMPSWEKGKTQSDKAKRPKDELKWNKDKAKWEKATHLRGPAPVRNGTIGTIVGLNHDEGFSLVKLEDNRLIRVNLNEAEKEQPIGPRYAQSAYKAQGGECEITQIVPGTDHTANANSAYAQNTRAKGESHIYLDTETHSEDPHKALAESWAQRKQKRMALSWLRNESKDIPHEPSADERMKIERDRIEELRGQQEQSEREHAPDLSDRTQLTATALRERLRTARPKAPEQGTEQTTEPQQATTQEQQPPLIREERSLRDRFSLLREFRQRNVERDQDNDRGR